ncbi:glycosyltransferase [Polaribacter sp. IC073]|uniref:glycosyltransferase n=1 Tax=Polaribacter sp. IC073 TaxID=2508540 RepID=UPI0011BD7EC9|nr:glycosyltransferase family 2 protein [Polaribacter sp. IC073]TXD47756.1 glycosyltransferase family 2 protein [Polaribacter sp. IC073]
MIGIILLNYNSYQDTINLVAELQLQTLAKELQIIIVDNASPNNSYEQLKPLEKQYQNVVVLQTGANLGYAKGNNFGLDYLDKHIKPTYVAILNNDIILPYNCFEKLVEKYTILDKPAIIAPKQLDVNNREFLPYKINTFLDDCLNLFYIFKLFHKRNALPYTDTSGQRAMKVEMIPGSFMFASFERFKKMGFFYPNTFLFVEERFIAVKAAELGFNNYILLDETYVHAHSKTINTVFNPVKKFQLLYVGWLEFTKVCRTHGNLKSVILKPLMQLSLLEMQIVYRIKKICQAKK